MTRTPFSIVADGILPYIPPWILRSLDSIPSKAMRKLRRNRELVNEVAKERVEFGLNDSRKGMGGGKDVLSQIGTFHPSPSVLDYPQPNTTYS
jgi:hypothetical protein